MTANHVINILPTPKLRMQSPHNKLYKQEPSYDYLRVFDCACYPCRRLYAQHKFDPRSLTCVFIGYSERHKGYRCLLPTTGRVYISRHVIFNENFFPFTKTYIAKSTPLTTLYRLWTEEVKLLNSVSEGPVSTSSQIYAGHLQDNGNITTDNFHSI